MNKLVNKSMKKASTSLSVSELDNAAMLNRLASRETSTPEMRKKDPLSSGQLKLMAFEQEELCESASESIPWHEKLGGDVAIQNRVHKKKSRSLTLRVRWILHSIVFEFFQSKEWPWRSSLSEVFKRSSPSFLPTKPKLGRSIEGPARKAVVEPAQSISSRRGPSRTSSVQADRIFKICLVGQLHLLSSTVTMLAVPTPSLTATLAHALKA